MLPEAVFETDRDLELTFANRRAFELFGYSVEELKKGLNGLALLAPEDRDHAKVNIAGRLTGEDLGTTEYKALRKDGSIFPILIHLGTIMNEGAAIGFRGIGVDITERKRAEEDREVLRATRAGPEDGVRRSTGRRCRSRFQQHADRYNGVC
ncbi:MAG: PAS domain S-box protein [Pseudomonadota bacterium]